VVFQSRRSQIRKPLVVTSRTSRMKRTIILLISVILTSCLGHEETVQEKIETYLKIKLTANWDNSNMNLISRNIDYIHPYKCFIKINADYSEFVKITTHFNLQTEEEKKAGKLNWWDISIENKDMLRVGFINNASEYYIQPLKPKEESVGKLIVQYKNGYIYLNCGSLL
jgi:hypothetical protein